MRKFFSFLIHLLCGLLILAGLIGCGPGSKNKWKNKESNNEEQDQSVFVETSEVRLAPVSESLQASGVIHPKKQVSLMPQRPGRIIRVNVEEGDKVKKGQLLGALDNERETILVNRVSLQLEKLVREQKRVEQLVKEKIQPQETLDNLNYSIQEARLSLLEAQKNLRETKLVAPFSGTIVERLWEKGATAIQGSPAFVLIGGDALEVRLGIPEDRLGSVRVEQNVDVFPLAAPNERFEGTVLRLHPAVDPQSGTVEVIISLKPNAFLKPGMFVRAQIHTNHKAQATLVAKKALLYQDDKTYLFKTVASETGLTAQKIEVKTGMSNGDQIEIHGDIKLGDQIIIQGQNGLKNGTAIRTSIEKPKPSDTSKSQKKKRHSARHRP